MRQGLCVMGAVAALAAGSAGSAGAAGWSVQPVPSPSDAGFPLALLSGVSCARPSACTAVGRYSAADDTERAFATRWDGRVWQTQQVPSPPGARGVALDGVSCPTRRSCVAVGHDQGPFRATMLAEHWDGATWRLEPVPEPPGATSTTLLAVSCATRTHCFAVGSFTSVGGVTAPMALRWDGRAWTVAAPQAPAGAAWGSMTGVSCATPRACVAVGGVRTGGVTGPGAWHWDGRAWEARPVPAPAGATFPELSDVSCATGGACTAVGYPGTPTMAARWDGGTWTLQQTPAGPPGSFSQLDGVSCPARRACTAVGPSPASVLTLAERWDGSTWQRQPTPSAPGADLSSLTAVSCPSRRACTAVGFFFGRAGGPLPLALHWSAGR